MYPDIDDDVGEKGQRCHLCGQEGTKDTAQLLFVVGWRWSLPSIPLPQSNVSALHTSNCYFAEISSYLEKQRFDVMWNKADEGWGERKISSP